MEETGALRYLYYDLGSLYNGGRQINSSHGGGIVPAISHDKFRPASGYRIRELTIVTRSGFLRTLVESLRPTYEPLNAYLDFRGIFSRLKRLKFADNLKGKNAERIQ